MYISVCATNIVGRDTSSAELYMEGLGKIDDTSYIDPETLRRMQKRWDIDFNLISESTFCSRSKYIKNE